MSSIQTTPTERQLRAQAKKLNAQLHEIEKKKGQARRKALVGKCFKFHNSFGGEERWWLYVKVTDAGEWWPKSIAFQRKSNGEFEFRSQDTLTSTDSYTAITREEFDGALNQFMEELREASSVVAGN